MRSSVGAKGIHSSTMRQVRSFCICVKCSPKAIPGSRKNGPISCRISRMRNSGRRVQSVRKCVWIQSSSRLRIFMPFARSERDGGNSGIASLCSRGFPVTLGATIFGVVVGLGVALGQAVECLLGSQLVAALLEHFLRSVLAFIATSRQRIRRGRFRRFFFLLTRSHEQKTRRQHHSCSHLPVSHYTPPSL